jgi:hypothetical protein
MKRATGPEREGKAMMKTQTNSLKISNCLFDLKGTIMPTAKDAVWLIDECLLMTGSSRCLGWRASARIVG